MPTYLLKPPARKRPADYDLMAKAPLIPLRYACQKYGYSLAVYKPQQDGEAYRVSVNFPGFWERFEKYYRERFEVSETGDELLPAEDYSPLLQLGPAESQEANDH